MIFYEHVEKIEAKLSKMPTSGITLLTMLSCVERQRPTCVAFSGHHSIDVSPVLSALDYLWETHFLNSWQDAHAIIADIRARLFEYGMHAEPMPQLERMPTFAAIENVTSALMHVIDFGVKNRLRSPAMCMNHCLEAVREEVYIDLQRALFEQKDKKWPFTASNSPEYAREMECVYQGSLSDHRTQQEVKFQIDLLESITLMPITRLGNLESIRKLVLPHSINSLGFG